MHEIQHQLKSHIFIKQIRTIQAFITNTIKQFMLESNPFIGVLSKQWCPEQVMNARDVSCTKN